VETNRLFTDRFGRAVKLNSDYHAWKALLKRQACEKTAGTTPGTQVAEDAAEEQTSR
jgi:hypothetical protein